MDFQKAEHFIFNLLKTKLPAGLYYHSAEHTLDVLNAAATLAHEEGITSSDDITLLKTAALFHDCGFIHVYKNHEEEGCRIAREVLPPFDYTQNQIDQICSLILKTKYGSIPETLAEKILCDADLDYLGRDDYDAISRNLYLELTGLDKIKTTEEWNRLQISFLQSHRYYTHSAQVKRERKKADVLKRLKEMV
jgi:HD superfamily phosphodiesterase